MGKFPISPTDRETLLEEGSYMGYRYSIHHNGLGFRCGYVLIPPSHPWFRRDYDNIQRLFEVDVHGGLTHGLSETDGFVIGFDCVHLGDGQDQSLPCRIELSRNGTIRTQAFVRKECKKLIQQAFKIGGPPSYT